MQCRSILRVLVVLCTALAVAGCAGSGDVSPPEPVSGGGSEPPETSSTTVESAIETSGPDDATQSVPCELIADLIAASHSTVQEGIISFNLHRQSWFSEYRRFLFQIQSLDAPGISEVAGTLRKEISAALDAEGSASVNTIELSRALSTECQIDLPASQFHFGG